MIQTTILFRSPHLAERFWSGMASRQQVSKWLGDDLDPALFHYQEDRITRAHHHPLVRWTGRRSAIGLVGIGAEAVGLIDRSVGPIAEALSRHVGPCAIHRFREDCSWSSSAYAQTYLAKDVALASTVREFHSLVLDATEAQVQALARTVIERSLHRQYQAMADQGDIEAFPPLDDDDRERLRPRILAVGPLRSQASGPGKPIYTVADVAFEAPLELKGDWSAGRNIHCGLGQIRRSILPAGYDSWADYLAHGRRVRVEPERMRERAQMARDRHALRGVA